MSKMAAKMPKRQLDLDYEERTRAKRSPSQSSLESLKVAKYATVEGIVSSISPMRKKHFEGELTNGDRCIRIIGFDSSQHSKLSNYHNEKYR